MSDDRTNQDEMAGPENNLREQNHGQTPTGVFGDNDDAADEDLEDADLDDSDLGDEQIEEPDADEDGPIGEDSDLDVENE